MQIGVRACQCRCTGLKPMSQFQHAGSSHEGTYIPGRPRHAAVWTRGGLGADRLATLAAGRQRVPPPAGGPAEHRRTVVSDPGELSIVGENGGLLGEGGPNPAPDSNSNVPRRTGACLVVSATSAAQLDVTCRPVIR
jgi:hypothetical protein